MKPGKIVHTTEDAWEAQQTYKDQPRGWIQWKGSDICMDVHCKCGAFLHVDGYFAHHVQCPHCNVVYMCNGHIELIEVLIPPGRLTIVAERDEDLN